MGLGNAINSVFTNPSQETAAVLISVAGAIVGVWLSAAASRRQARKQHTVTVLLDAGMDPSLRQAMRDIAPCLQTGKCPDYQSVRDKKLRQAFGLLLNHYEFIAAGIRNGDFDEMLVYDSEHRTMMDIFDTYMPNILVRRSERDVDTLFEHLAWLRRKWSRKRPMTFRRAWQNWRS